MPDQDNTQDQTPSLYDNDDFRAAATACLDMAMSGNSHWTQQSVIRMLQEFDVDCIAYAMILWIDTTVADCGQPVGIAAPLNPVNAVTGERMDIDSLSPAVRWACRMYAARMNADDDMVVALIDSLETDNQVSDSIMGLLYVCSSNLKNQPGSSRNSGGN